MEKHLLLIFLFTLIFSSSCTNTKQSYNKREKMITPKLDVKKCGQNIKCPPIENPICVKIKYTTSKFVMNSMFVLMLNKCEMEFMKCHEGLEAIIVSMKYCKSHKPIVQSVSTGPLVRRKRHKRSANLDELDGNKGNSTTKRRVNNPKKKIVKKSNFNNNAYKRLFKRNGDNDEAIKNRYTKKKLKMAIKSKKRPFESKYYQNKLNKNSNDSAEMSDGVFDKKSGNILNNDDDAYKAEKDYKKYSDLFKTPMFSEHMFNDDENTASGVVTLKKRNTLKKLKNNPQEENPDHDDGNINHTDNQENQGSDQKGQASDQVNIQKVEDSYNLQNEKNADQTEAVTNDETEDNEDDDFDKAMSNEPMFDENEKEGNKSHSDISSEKEGRSDIDSQGKIEGNNDRTNADDDFDKSVFSEPMFSEPMFGATSNEKHIPVQKTDDHGAITDKNGNQSNSDKDSEKGSSYEKTETHKDKTEASAGDDFDKPMFSEPLHSEPMFSDPMFSEPMFGASDKENDKTGNKTHSDTGGSNEINSHEINNHEKSEENNGTNKHTDSNNTHVDILDSIHKNDSKDEIVDRKEYQADCPTQCPARQVMVCAKCKDNVYKTFMSVCHMRMFSCQHPEEKIELVSRSPCALSAPYLQDMPPPKGVIREPNDDDEVLKYLYCKENAC